MTARRITAAMLREHGACQSKIATFEKAWPKGVVPTLASARKAIRLGLSISWAANHLLSPPALRAYNKANALAWKAYDEACALAWKAYDEACAPARKAYDEACAPARKAFDEACALAFASAWKMDGGK